jgi:hypothetical protein
LAATTPIVVLSPTLRSIGRTDEGSSIHGRRTIDMAVAGLATASGIMEYWSGNAFPETLRG